MAERLACEQNENMRIGSQGFGVGWAWIDDDERGRTLKSLDRDALLGTLGRPLNRA